MKEWSDENYLRFKTVNVIISLLINGQLLSYTDDKKDKPINMALLMGYDNNQLSSILKNYHEQVEKKDGRKYTNSENQIK